MDPAPLISFVVPVRNDARRLRTCLDAIARATAGTSEVIVIDNGSDDGSDRVARDAGAIVLTMPEGSVAQLRNRGAATATGRVLAFVDADNEIAPGWMSAALETLGRDSTIAAAGAPYSAPAGANWVQRAYDSLRSHQGGVVDTEWLGSGNLAIQREAFERIGGFDNALQTCEDVDLCRRVRAQGLRLVADSRMRSTHHGDPATLRAVFFGELWRGRDNLRVSVRRPIALRVLASLAVSAVQLVSLAVILVGGIAVFVVAPLYGAALAAAGGAVFATIVAWRAARMLATRNEGRITSGPGAVLVAGTYELARALALAVGASHGRRRAEETR